MEADSAPWDPSFNCVCPLVASLVLWALKLSTASTQTGTQGIHLGIQKSGCWLLRADVISRAPNQTFSPFLEDTPN